MAAVLALSLGVGSIVYFIESESIDRQVMDLASSETTQLMSYVNQFDGNQKKYEVLSKNAGNLLSSHFITIEIHNKDKQQIFEKTQSQNIEVKVDQIKHGLPLEDKISYKKFTIGKHLYLQFLVPLKDKKSHLFGYLGGLYKVDDLKLADINHQVMLTVLQTILIVIATTLFLIPMIFALNRYLYSYSKKLIRANVDVLKVIGGAIAKRDADTSAHNYRVTIYSVKLAEQIHLDKIEMRKLIKGAFVHDVGKIAIADKILLKPGKLTGEEFDIMKTHVQHGEDIIKEAEWLKDGRDIVAFHHEKYDGTGYMKGLSGENIPLNARIFAIADVFDALTSERPYKKPYSYETAIQILKDGKGTHFDPQLIGEFLKISKKLYMKVAKSGDDKAQELVSQLLNKYFYNDHYEEMSG